LIQEKNNILCLIFLKDHHSEKAFPEGYHVYLNIGFGAASGFSALFFGILGDYTVGHSHTSEKKITLTFILTVEKHK